MRLRYYASCLLFLLFSLMAGFAYAAPADSAVVITGMRWGKAADAVTGSQTIRLVLETSAPVSVDQFITAKPNWRIVLTLQGVSADQLKILPSPDPEVVKALSTVKSTKNTLHVMIDLPAELNANQYKVFTLKADPKAKRPFRIVVDIEKPVPVSDMQFSTGLRGKLIVLDPGHGGTDPGAIGPRRSYEKNLNWSITQQVKTILERAGSTVLLTRPGDVDLTPASASDRDELRVRTMVANNRKADIFVSIHHNSSVNSDLNGTSTYYYPKTPYDAMLAQCLQSAMVRGGGLENIGIRTANFFVVKNAWMPAALLEIGYISNPQEEQLLNSPAFQQKMALAIVAGMDQFFAQAAKMRGGR